MTENNINKKCSSCQELKNEQVDFNKKRAECKICQKDRRRKYNLTDRAIKLDMLKHARHRAVKYNLEYSITIEDIPQLPEYCPVFPWIKLERSQDKATDNSYTLDRIDNNKGYVKGNIKVISNRANSCKRDMNRQELEALLAYVVNEESYKFF